MIKLGIKGSCLLSALFHTCKINMVYSIVKPLYHTQGSDGFQKKSLHPCALDESSLSIGKVKMLLCLATALVYLVH